MPAGRASRDPRRRSPVPEPAGPDRAPCPWAAGGALSKPLASCRPYPRPTLAAGVRAEAARTWAGPRRWAAVGCLISASSPKPGLSWPRRTFLLLFLLLLPPTRLWDGAARLARARRRDWGGSGYRESGPLRRCRRMAGGSPGGYGAARICCANRPASACFVIKLVAHSTS